MQETLEFVRKDEIGMSSVTFRDFVLKDKFNRAVVILCALIIVVELCLFKYFYPYASFINGDSFSYLDSAFFNLKMDTYPIGYPKFLRLFSVFSTSDTVLVVFQYAFMQCSLLWLYFTLPYFYRICRWLHVVLILAVLGPASLYMANYVSSDSLFFSLSVCWFCTLVWILNRPSKRFLVAHVFFVVWVFTVRYNAVYYPIISCIAFFLNRENVKAKLIAISAVGLIIGAFILYTSNEYKKLAGQFQFSPFSGWQMANNAMYAYKFVDSSKRKPVPDRFKDLDNHVRNYFDSTKDHRKYPTEMLTANTVYMWSPYSPLRIYMEQYSKNDSTIRTLKKWAAVGPLYNDYGRYLIKSYPLTYAKTYLWPNFVKYYSPPVEFLGSYGFNVDTLIPPAKTWFDYPTNKVYTRFKDKYVGILNYYPIICGTLNAVFVMMSISFLILGGRSTDPKLFKIWILFATFWVVNLSFSVFAAPVALRFQLFPLALCLPINLLLLDFMLKKERSK